MERLVYITIGLILLLFLSLGCEDQLAPPYEQRIVVQGYLYADEPVNDISLFQTASLELADTSGDRVADALVTLIRGQQSFELIYNDSSRKYEHPDTAFTVKAGDEIDLRLSYRGLEASASTVVPDAPQNVLLSKDTIQLRDLFTKPGSGDSIQEQEEDENLMLTWSNPDNSYYFVVINNVEEEKVELFDFSQLPDRFQGSGFSQLNRGQLISKPTTDDEYYISSQYFDYLGMHEVILYKVNEEYAELYENQEQDSRDLTAPPSNVLNGLGIFTSFNGVKKHVILSRRRRQG